MNTTIDSESEEQWCIEQQKKVAEYLGSQQVHHGRIGEWPAWHIWPYVSVWAIESVSRPEWIGWWVIIGDLPTDYISAADVLPPQHPRKAASVFARKWLEQAAAWKEGRDYQGIHITGSYSQSELAPMLESRANILLKWVEDDSLWEE